MPGEGFAEARPADAVDVKPAGQRVHHVDEVPDGEKPEAYEERVQDGFDSETYTERVDDGFTTETYTEREQSGTRSESSTERYDCGEDCTTAPKSCRQVCTNQKNGFAKCNDVCTGGARSCTPKSCTRTVTKQIAQYRDVTKTRQVKRTREVTRTRQVPRFKMVQRTRMVPKTRPVERMAAWLTWSTWAWKEARVVTREGTTIEPAWPGDDEVALEKGIGKGEKERAEPSGVYRARLVDEGGHVFEAEVASPGLLQGLAMGARGTVTIDHEGAPASGFLADQP